VVSNESVCLKVFDRGCVRVRCGPKRYDSRFGLLFEHDVSGKPLHTFPDHALMIRIRGMMGEDRNSVFAFMPTDKSSSNPAAGRNGQGARMTRKDGRHPKSENHGRIAGR
jgi:hypothetical protein